MKSDTDPNTSRDNGSAKKREVGGKRKEGAHDFIPNARAS
jgi:hypothetical protein